MEAPSEFKIGGKHRIIRASDTSDITDGDPRGLIFLFEPPNPRARYVMGVDATQGITGWNRYSRAQNDSKVDNGAIEVFRVGRGEPGTPMFQPMTQVAEYAAPIDPYDLGTVANALGRLYGGRDEDGQALAIVEVYPGPGGPTQRTMQEKHGYTNLYRWQYLDTGEQADKKVEFGWYSTRQSMQHLWTRGLRAIHRRQAIFKSPYLVEEFADCVMDTVKNRGAASSGNHDDRAMATLLCIWAANNWTFAIENIQTRVETGPTVEWQSTDISNERLESAWEERWEELSREAEQDFA